MSFGLHLVCVACVVGLSVSFSCIFFSFTRSITSRLFVACKGAIELNQYVTPTFQFGGIGKFLSFCS